MVERVSTGIPGLDDLIEGGFPAGSVTLLSGGAGTGKTLFSSQFLWEGLQNGENGLFVTMEEEPDEIKADAEEFGWDFEEYEENGEFDIVYLNPFKDSGGFSDRVRQKIEEVGAERVVIDSVSVMGMYDESPGKIRERLYDLVRKLRREDVTVIITGEIPKGDSEAISRYGVEEFVSDGVIVLKKSSVSGGKGRRIKVEKMRKTDIDENISKLQFTGSGLEVEELEKGLSV